MVLAMSGVVVLTSLAAIVLFSRGHTLAHSAYRPATHVASPVDEAERIIARRYARGEITAEEYDRMLVILRH